MKNGNRKPLALVPARRGSQRLQNKNIALLGGKPLIAWTIETALAAGIFDAVWVSSEDEEILKIAERFGGSCLLRQPELARDDITLVQLCWDILEQFKQEKRGYTDLYLLLPTSPFRSVKSIKTAWEKYLASEAKGLLSIISLEHPPQWALTIEGERLRPLYPSEYERTRMQLRTAYRHDGGHCIANIREFLKVKTFLGLNPVSFEVPAEEAVDINTGMDLKWAEFLMKEMQNIECRMQNVKYKKITS